MSDLQCPARLFVVSLGSVGPGAPWVGLDDALTPVGCDRSRRIASALQHEQISRVWTGPRSWAVQAARIAAALLGVEVVVRADLAGPVAGASETHAPSPHLAVLEEIADLHRGESVLVVDDGGVVAQAYGRSPQWWEVLPLEGDADGWTVRA